MSPFSPLDDVRVLDLSQFVPGPYGTCLLGDLGADVIKVEHPAGGDELRALNLESDEGPSNHYFAMLNRNKRSVTLDLKTERGQGLFYRLVETADVVVESFRPGTVDRLGVDVETLREHNADLVYCSVTGYGQHGPYSDRPGHDINFQAVSGVAGIREGGPAVSPVPYADLAGGAFTCLSVLAALLGDEAQYVDVSMTDVLATWTLPFAAQEFVGAGLEAGEPTRHEKYPSYGYYETADGGYVALAAVEPRFWANLCDALDLEDLRDRHHADDPATREAVRERLAETFVTRTREEWMDALDGQDVPLSPVTRLDELADSPHVRDRSVVATAEGFGTQFRFPTLFSAAVPHLRDPAPAHGEHTDEVLSDLGVAEAEREQLRADGVV